MLVIHIIVALLAGPPWQEVPLPVGGAPACTLVNDVALLCDACTASHVIVDSSPRLMLDCALRTDNLHPLRVVIDVLLPGTAHHHHTCTHSHPHHHMHSLTPSPSHMHSLTLSPSHMHSLTLSPSHSHPHHHTCTHSHPHHHMHSLTPSPSHMHSLTLSVVQPTPACEVHSLPSPPTYSLCSFTAIHSALKPFPTEPGPSSRITHGTSRLPRTSNTACSTEYGSTEYGSTEYGSTEYGSTEYGSTEYGSTEYGSMEYGSTEYGSTEYGSDFHGSPMPDRSSTV